MPTTNLYSPNIQKPSAGDKFSDTFLGTNKVESINQQNQMEYWKAANINKYSYNVQGMLNAGINPLVNAAGLNGTTNSPVSTNYSSNLGAFGDYVLKSTKNILSQLTPNSKEEQMEMLKILLSFLK